ncbi:MAG: small multi-drug export protein [bacterium]|nr:small multi-drug export protein [bacterium]
MLQELHILFISMLPIIELRGSIPFAIAVYGFPVWKAFLVAIIGNIIPALFIIPLIGKVDEFLSKKSPLWQRLYNHYLTKTRDNHQKKFELIKEFALVVLVAIPLPLTGAWTAALVAYIFGIPLRKAIPLILLGLVIAGVIMVLATAGVTAIF